jgi:hypothetical protein
VAAEVALACILRSITERALFLEASLQGHCNSQRNALTETPAGIGSVSFLDPAQIGQIARDWAFSWMQSRVR